MKLALARSTNNLPEKKNKETPAERILRNDSTVSFPTSLPLFFVLAPFRESSFAESRKPDLTENSRKAIRYDFPFIEQIINAGSNDDSLLKKNIHIYKIFFYEIILS